MQLAGICAGSLLGDQHVDRLRLFIGRLALGHLQSSMASEQEGCCSPYVENACLKADRWDAAQNGDRPLRTPA